MYYTEKGTGIAMDADGNVFTTGEFVGGSADFDPGPAVVTMSSLGITDAFISKLDSNMNYQWAFQIGSYEKYTDDGDPGYQEIGTGWKSPRFVAGYAGDYRYHAKGNGANKAQWTFSGLVPGDYSVFAHWYVDVGNKNATDARYTINGVAAPLINQRLQPDEQHYTPLGTTSWKRLGVFSADQLGKITVILSDKANGNVIADAIRVVLHQPAGVTTMAAGSSSDQAARLASLPGDSSAGTSPVTSASTDAAFTVLADDPVPVWPATATPAVSTPAKVRVAQKADLFSQDDLLDDPFDVADALLP